MKHITKMKTLHTILFLIAGSLIFLSCDSTSSDSQLGTMQVLLTDAPGNYDHVYIDIREARIHHSSDAEEGESGWIDLEIEPGIYDLLELTNGRYEVLGEMDLEPGRYNQMRLILGDQNEVVMNGTSHSLMTPSAQQSGLKLNIHADIEGGEMYTLLLDFDANKSIVHAGASGNILLKPVIRTVQLEQTGTIEGTIEPAEALPWVYAIAGQDTVRGTLADTDGDFKLIGLPSDTYQISILPTHEDYNTTVVSGVEVSVGETTEMGTITIEN
jgi:hypothetical protein